MDKIEASSIAGYVSILLWLIVFIPQLLENYKRKSGDGLSIVFLFVWLLGDIFNLIGIVMEDLMFTMFLLALWYTVADIGLIWQVIYYQQVTLYTKLKQEESSNGSIDMAAKRSAFWINLVGSSVLITVVVISCYAYNSDLFNDSDSTLSGLIGWASAVLYIGSRLPQIIKNWKAQSTEGLSSGMFICALFGNFSFTLSIFLKSTEKPYILQNLPWIVGSLGTIIFDIMVK
ncbi:PQ-loop-domain-containing protein [Rhizopus microsporus var. microsporus]|uniref:PQ-loop-domain-containing protein n=2 Tax=Rhizopus microsporus TaxID=58291 RepID=A0A2G4T299_RHIZD|nr:PQ-loop-domain-containing protein [Rhizopus microsporus ATCC 52813]ORE02157.1 PQ-loop-domain-containing protein [Rhizopus microsporus var. microsporus]PHZ15138.1 PQ-loop-domain-containing protein [Rhizopus microsporus ATCC 52813]